MPTPYERLMRGAKIGPTVLAEIGPCLDYRSVLSTDRHPMVIIGTRPVRCWVSGARLVLEHGLERPLHLGMHALHHCDRPICIRFSHLYEGTQLENVRDRDQRTGNPLAGRDMAGSSHPKSKLTESDVHEIRFLAYMGVRTARIVDLFPRVSRSLIYLVAKGRCWTHV